MKGIIATAMGIAVVFAGGVGTARAACNLIPSAQTTFRGAVGASDRPFAGPGDLVELRVRPALCDAASIGFSSSVDDIVVSVLFTPPDGGPVNVIAIANDCTGVQASCGAAPVRCEDADEANTPADLAIVERDGERRLLVRFPDTDGDLPPAGDDRTFAGPARIVVKDRRVAAPGSLAACEVAPPQRCATVGAVAGLVACIDELFQLDGTCRTSADVVDPTFGSFTALPPPNDYRAVCDPGAPGSPCAGTSGELRLTTDAAGNVLVPMDWRGILVPSEVPVPRLLRASTSQQAFALTTGPIVIPGQSFLASYTPEGAKLPPIFEPQFSPTSANELTVFGSADAPHTVLRAARRSAGFKECNNALNRPCNGDADCPGATPGSCDSATCCSDPTSCSATLCNSDAACGVGEECGPSVFELRPLYLADVGPVLITRTPTDGGVCSGDPGTVCTTDAECGGNAPCVALRIAAQDPVPLEGLAGTDTLFTFAQREADAGPRDLNGDGDSIDTVMVVRNRTTGEILPIGGGGADARAATQIRDGSFRFPAITGENDVVAFLESEPLEGGFVAQDKNGDGDAFDTIARVFRNVGGSAVDVLPGTDLAAESEPRIDGRSLAVSSGFAFFLSPESAGSERLVERVSVDTAGNEIVGGSENNPAQAISRDGRRVAFVVESNAFFLGDVNGALDIFVRDRDTDEDGIFDEPGAVATTLASYESTNSTTANGPSFYPRFSADGRFLIFHGSATNMVAGDSNGVGDVFVRDLLLATTTRVSVDSNGNQATGASSGSAVMSISADGRYAAFDSAAANLVADDGNGVIDVFVHDRDADGDAVFDEPDPGAVATRRISVSATGAEGNGASAGPMMTPNGRWIAFPSEASKLVPGDTNNATDIFLHDRDADADGVFDEVGATSIERINVSSSEAQAGALTASEYPVLTDDARYVVFSSNANLVPGDSDVSGAQDTFLRDRVAGTTSIISASSADSDSGGNVGGGSISADGRFVTLNGEASLLTSNPAPTGAASYVRDLVNSATLMVSVDPASGSGNNSQTLSVPEVSGDGRWVVFGTAADNLIAGDTNGRLDYYVAGVDLLSNDVSGDGRADDHVLYAVDALVGPPGTGTPHCPAASPSAAGGRVAFVRPEAAGEAPGLAACPAGPLVGGDPDLNGDADAADGVAHLWRGAGAVENLRCATNSVVLSPSYVAALVPEADEGGTPLNGDGLADDTVLKVYDLSDATPASCAAWTNVGVAADAVQISGDWIAFTTPESEQGVSLNGDGDQSDRVLQLYNADTATTINLGQAVEEFVLGTTLLAYRTREAAQGGQDLNLDGDAGDDVVQIYDLLATAPAAGFARQAVRPCQLEACDPRLPYRVFPNSVKFLTFECDQGGSENRSCAGGGTDLNNDGDAGDLVIQTFNVVSGQTKVVGTVAQPQDEVPYNSPPDPTLGDPLAPPDGSTEVFVSAGRCIEDLKSACNPLADACDNGAFCKRTGNNPSVGTCRRDQGVCARDSDCPPKVKCQLEPIVPASADADLDGVADVLDNCPTLSNTDQQDLDGDGVGDACDLQLCGNGVIEIDEPCDGATNATCAGPCLPDCTCDCTNQVADPRAVVKVTTRREAGKLTVNLSLPLASYTGENVTVRLSDGDSTIALQSVGLLSPRGNSGALWEYKFKGDGLRKVSLRDRGATMDLKIRAKAWFTAAAADQPAAATRVTVNVGNQCFTHVATKKID